MTLHYDDEIAHENKYRFVMTECVTWAANFVYFLVTVEYLRLDYKKSS